MLPEVREYYRTIDRAHREMEVTRDRIYREHIDDFRLNEEGRRLNRESLHNYETAMANAWKELGESDNRVIKFIVENVRQGDYDHEVKIVMEALPATLADLNQVARANNFCSVWDNFRERAVAAGVFGTRRIEFRRKGGRWGKFKPAKLPDGYEITLQRVDHLFKRGVKEITFTLPDTVLYYREVESEPDAQTT